MGLLRIWGLKETGPSLMGLDYVNSHLWVIQDTANLVLTLRDLGYFWRGALERNWGDGFHS